MQARWVLDTFWPEHPQIDYTVIARWWPWEYYCVSTIWVWSDKSDPIYSSTKRSSGLPQEYVTYVFKCDKEGKGDTEYFYYMKEYPDTALARRGHKDAVELLSKGIMKLIRQDFN